MLFLSPRTPQTTDPHSASTVSPSPGRHGVGIIQPYAFQISCFLLATRVFKVPPCPLRLHSFFSSLNTVALSSYNAICLYIHLLEDMLSDLGNCE